MQSILREKLIAQAIKLSEVSALYKTEKYRFANAYLEWLENAEKDLSSLRSPVSILLQAEKATVSSALDGYRPDYIVQSKSIRKNQLVVAAKSLEKISREFYIVIGNIDGMLEQLNEKMCHAVAVIAGKVPDLYDSIQPDKQGIETVWNLLKSNPETNPIFNYFSAKLPVADRNYILTDIIVKIKSNRNGSPA